jgi:hydroxyacylglutathione hydrolase
MKKLFVLLTITLLFTFACAHTEIAPVNSEAKLSANKVTAIKAGKEEGTIDKEFFKKIVAEKPVNVALVDVRTPFEYKAGHFEGAKHLFINELYSKGCDVVLPQLPKEEFVVFVCATGARAAEMYFGIKDDCKKADVKRLFFLDAEVMYPPNGPVIK